MSVNRYKAPCAVCGNQVPANGGKLVRKARGWVPVHLACESGQPGVVSYTFSSGETVTQNRDGRCEDAPCCGCCT